MDPQTVDSAYRALVEQYPSFAQTASAEQFQQLMAQGLKLMAIDFGEGGGVTQLSVVQQPLPIEMSLDYYTQAYASASEVKYKLPVTIDVGRLAGRDARIVSYDIPWQHGADQIVMRSSNYLLIHAKSVYVLNFFTSKDRFEQTRSMFAEIAGTFSLRP
jgi:hypothetical protein